LETKFVAADILGSFIHVRKLDAGKGFSITSHLRAQRPMTFDLSLGESTGSRLLERFVGHPPSQTCQDLSAYNAFSDCRTR
jgi:hypothetical protein